MIENIITLTKAFADGNRMRILMALQHAGELCPCQITELLEVSGATISRHLGVLQRSAIVESRNVGKWAYFRLKEDQEHQTMITWLSSQLESTEQIQRDREALTAILALDPEDICRKQRGTECCPVPSEEGKEDK
ncbi:MULTISPECIES: ArsR/SmtB family transcription factor [Desulfosediminicola]|uniref:ArsR/SmtB family transcription factor n=1 Tax=Desulfosediminicola TaxID=2886823 RepID=UPI0010AC62DC|nr:metalloregulator ArsR/SmtB family transcription factor [Desulfosediminicola ganghwensis]